MTAKAVKFMHSGQIGAPSVSGTAGHMIALLDALLVNGWGTGNVDSIVVASGVATVTRAAGHPFELDTVALMAGATGSFTGLNGEHEVTEYTTTTYKFLCPGVPDGTATGSITHKIAPLGWSKAFSGTNLAAYKSSDVAATGCLLRVDDTGTTTAAVRGYETMSDINTGAGPFPTVAQSATGYYLLKSDTASTATRQWMLVGDSRAFYLWVRYYNGNSAFTHFFGDLVSYRTPDAYACALSMSTVTTPGANPTTSDFAYAGFSTAATAGCVVPRGFSAIGSSQGCIRAVVPAPAWFNISNAQAYSGDASSSSGVFTYPNPSDNGLYLSKMWAGDTNPLALRGEFPGAYYSMQAIGINVFADVERVTGVVGLSGRALRTAKNARGPLFFDVTGPWR